VREQLETLIREFLHVIHNLHKERKGVDLIKQQLKHLEDMRTNMNVDKDNSDLVQYQYGQDFCRITPHQECHQSQHLPDDESEHKSPSEPTILVLILTKGNRRNGWGNC